MGFIGKLLSSSTQKKENSMKYLIVGLGNMGTEYDNTRHNIGFNVVEYIAEEKNASWEYEKRGDIARVRHAGRQLILLKPSTYVNLSGKAVRYWMQKEKISIDRLLIVVDDLHIPFGKLRMRPSGSDGGHNGLKSIQAILGTQKYARLRMGIGAEFHSGQQVNFVLGKWTRQETKELENIIPKAWEAIIDFSRMGIQQAMNRHNS